MKPLKTKLQKTGYVLGIALSAFVVGTLLQFAKAWSEPTVAPPTATIGAPINTSANSQIKTGIFTAGALVSPEICLGSSPCITSWPTSTPTAGDNMGNEVATTNMNMMGSYSINNANNVSAINLYASNDVNSEYVTAIDVDAQALNAYQSLWTSGPAYAGTYYDVNNENYYVIPSGTSKMNAIQFSDGTTQTSAGIAKNSCTVRTVRTYTAPNVDEGLNTTITTINCNSGEIATGGGCYAQSVYDSYPVISSSNVATGWNCTGGLANVVAYAICCK